MDSGEGIQVQLSEEWEQDVSRTFPAGLGKRFDSSASPTFSLLGFMGQIIEKELFQISVTESVTEHLKTTLSNTPKLKLRSTEFVNAL